MEDINLEDLDSESLIELMTIFQEMDSELQEMMGGDNYE